MSRPGHEFRCPGPGVAPCTISLCLLEAEETLRKSMCNVVSPSLAFIAYVLCAIDLYNGANTYLV